MEALIIFFGFLFGLILKYANLNKFDVISGLALKKDFTVAKALAVAIGLGIIILNIEIAAGVASYHIKPFILGGLVLGGLIFGTGMAILGYCPGTLAISFGEGSLDALTGIIGGLLGGLFYTVVLPYISPVLGPNLGKISLNSVMGTNILFFIVAIIIGAVFIYSAFIIDKKDEINNKKWLYSGIALAILNSIVFLNPLTGRPIGASTTYPYVADKLAGLTENAYFLKIATPGRWELIFLTGAFLAGLIISLVKKEFKFVLVHKNWKKYKNSSTSSRIFWAFTGGFILVFGARMAGGCTSGHILSGDMQLAISSLTFTVFVFAGLLITGKLFYDNK